MFGRYREVAVLQRKSETRDDAGGVVTSWVDVENIFFEQDPQSRSLELLNGVIDAPHIGIWRTWYREDFDTSNKMNLLYRLKYDDLQWIIHSVRDLRRRRDEIELIVYSVNDYELSEVVSGFPYTFPLTLA